MKYLKRFNENLGLNPSLETQKTEDNHSYQQMIEISEICKKYDIENWTLNPETGLVDVDGDVYLYYNLLEKIPLNFGKVTGDFNCSSNKLLSLEGSPRSVGGDFWCSYNNLISLEFCPKNVGENFYCDNNKLISFEGCPQNIGGRFECDFNPVYQIWELFEKFYDIELFNEFDPIRIIDGESKPVVILDRLNGFLEMTGRPTTTGSNEDDECILLNYKLI